MRRHPVRGDAAAPPHRRLPLHRLPANDRQCYSLSVAIPTEGFRVTAGEPLPGGATPHIGHFFCPACMSWMFTRPKGFDQFVNVRPTMLDDVAWFVPFIETFRSEALPWARTPARHSFDAFPPMEMYVALVQEYAEAEGRA